MIIEIAAGSASLDSGAKLQFYQRNQVQEYLVWRVDDGEFDWFRLENNHFMRVGADSQGILRSGLFPGLWLDQNALLNGDLATVFSALQQGLTSEEHQTYTDKDGLLE